MSTVAKAPSAIVERVNNEMRRLISQAPRDAEGEGMANLLDRILSANDVDGLANLNKGLDNSSGAAKLGNLLITGIVARDSDIEDAPLGIFLTVHYERVGKGLESAGAFNTGAVSMVAMLLKLHDMDAFPVEARVEVKALKGGNTASNLIIV